MQVVVLTSPVWPRLSFGSLFFTFPEFPTYAWLLLNPSVATRGGLSWGESLGAWSWPSIGRTYAVGFCWTAIGFPDRLPGGKVGVVSPDVGVVRPGVGVVRTDVEANGEEDVDRWEPVSFSNGEDLKCPPFSVLMEDLKWPPSMVEDRKLPPSVKEKEKGYKTKKKWKITKATPGILEYCCALCCQS